VTAGSKKMQMQREGSRSLEGGLRCVCFVGFCSGWIIHLRILSQ
jgi:hypothetical protein